MAPWAAGAWFFTVTWKLLGSGQAARIGGCDRDRGRTLRDGRDRHRAADGAGRGHGLVRRRCRVGQHIAVRDR